MTALRHVLLTTVSLPTIRHYWACMALWGSREEPICDAALGGSEPGADELFNQILEGMANG